MSMVAAAAVVSLSIARAGTQPSQKGPCEYFTGSVRIDPLFQATAMTHLAIQEHLNGKVVEWMEKVTDEQYAGAARR
jgi:hypothetical protein